MPGRIVWITAVAAGLLALAFFMTRDDGEPAGERMRLAPPSSVANRMPRPPAPVDARVDPPAGTSPTATAAALATYERLRDDVNPKPRLLLIEDWARAARPEDGVDLLTSAMTDPDESVRARAQALFDRRLEAR